MKMSLQKIFREASTSPCVPFKANFQPPGRLFYPVTPNLFPDYCLCLFSGLSIFFVDGLL